MFVPRVLLVRLFYFADLSTVTREFGRMSAGWIQWKNVKTIAVACLSWTCLGRDVYSSEIFSFITFVTIRYFIYVFIVQAYISVVRHAYPVLRAKAVVLLCTYNLYYKTILLKILYISSLHTCIYVLCINVLQYSIVYDAT